jgi:hypothetical protein
MAGRRGDIEARLRLSTTDYHKNLNAALKETNRVAAEMRKAFSVPLKLPPIPPLKLPPVPTIPSGGGTKPTLR